MRSLKKKKRHIKSTLFLCWQVDLTAALGRITSYRPTRLAIRQSGILSSLAIICLKLIRATEPSSLIVTNSSAVRASLRKAPNRESKPLSKLFPGTYSLPLYLFPKMVSLQSLSTASKCREEKPDVQAHIYRPKPKNFLFDQTTSTMLPLLPTCISTYTAQ